VLACVGSQPVLADDSEIARRTAELEEIQQRLQQLEGVISETEASRSEAEKEVAEAEREVSRVSRNLRELTEKRVSNQRELAEREDEKAEVEARIGERQDELGAWARRHYMHGGSDVAPFLSGRDPNEIARDIQYLEYVGRARLALIEGLREDLREQRQLVEAIEARREELERLEAEHQSQLADLEEMHEQRAQALTSLSGELSTREREAESLRSNEEELASVIDVLSRRAEQHRRAPQQRTGQASIAPGSNSAEPVVGRADVVASDVSNGSAGFRQLRGKLGFPVQGELLGRFGAQRADGGTRWRGVFIRAGGGKDVVSIAPGKVVFSDWMRGYGNLIIVDHGDEYLSIYANNDALLRVVGESVNAGTAIASVGASGGGQESGVYFELRHEGEPVDPMPWLRSGG